MQAPMQPSSFARGLEVPTSFGARRSISHDLARFALDLGCSERRPSHQRIPYPSPPMSHSPPPVNPLSPNDPRHPPSTGYYNASVAPVQPSYGSYRYPQDHQQQQQPQHRQHQHQHQQQPSLYTNGNISGNGEPEPYPTPFPPITGSVGDRFSAPRIPPTGRSPFIPQTAFPPPPPPRRPKSHVASACVNCKKAHLACDTRRPCPRCVGLGKQDTCVDVQHKKRGRPRLRDDHRSHSFEIAQMQRPGVVSSPSSPAVLPSYRSNTHRVLKSQSDSGRYHRRPSLTPREDILGHHSSSYFDPQPSHRSTIIDLLSMVTPQMPPATAHLTADLLIVKSSERMRELLGYTLSSEIDCRKSLFDLVISVDTEKVHHLLTRIREDIRQREPKQWLSEQHLHAVIQRVGEGEAQLATQGSIAFTETLHMRRIDGQHLRIRVRAQVASTSIHFILMEFTVSNEMPPPLQLNNGSLVPYPNANHLLTPTASSASSMHSPSFLTSASQQHLFPQGNSRSGTQSPFSHAGVPLTPRTMKQDSGYPPLAPHLNPSPSSAATSSYRPSASPASAAPNTFSLSSLGQGPGLTQTDLQLPPLQLKRLPEYGEAPGRNRGTLNIPEEPAVAETPKRERIGVHEMLE